MGDTHDSVLPDSCGLNSTQTDEEKAERVKQILFRALEMYQLMGDYLNDNPVDNQVCPCDDFVTAALALRILFFTAIDPSCPDVDSELNEGVAFFCGQASNASLEHKGKDELTLTDELLQKALNNKPERMN